MGGNFQRTFKRNFNWNFKTQEQILGVKSVEDLFEKCSTSRDLSSDNRKTAARTLLFFHDAAAGAEEAAAEAAAAAKQRHA